ncbi:MAG: glycoside hydrolase [Actinomycetota bacterium]|nr:glycoside hydrolase [Actinomycetota bacterium]
MKRTLFFLAAAVLVAVSAAGSSFGRDRPFSTAKLKLDKLWYQNLDAFGAGGVFRGQTSLGAPFSKEQIERFRCASAGNPAATVDMSCNTETYGQDWSPDNEIAIAVNPQNPNHLVAGSNDYFYRFNNATGARQAIVPTGFFTSFDGGATWIDGQIPMRSGNGAGDPAPAFDVRHNVVLMSQLENTGGLGGPNVTQGDISVSRSTDGGVTWTEPVTVMQGRGNAFGQANQAIFYDKNWMTCNNYPGTRFYGRCWVTATLFLNALHGAYASSDILVSWSDDGGVTWTKPISIAAQHPSCTYQETGPEGSTACDENQFSIPEVATDGTLYIHFFNSQNEAAWEDPFDFDAQIMVMKSTTGGASFTGPFQVAQVEDGLTDMPFTVIGRQSPWGHQIRWNASGNITADPTNANHLTIVWSDRGTPNAAAPDLCYVGGPLGIGGEPPTYDPCNAGPGSDVSIWRSDSFDGGVTWTARTLVDAAGGRHQWFPWADYRPNGTLAIGWDEDVDPDGQPYVPKTSPPNDEFLHMLWTSNGGKQPLVPTTGTVPFEQVDISVTHWAGQYVPPTLWPRACGPMPYSDPPVTDAEGKDCNEFHGDYTGLATDSLGRVHVVWTGLNRFETSPQIDPYTGALHDGYAQDAMYARRP